jgi:mRNA-degrading endonuclease RelE of RelBE toxin-antitoxin system
MSYNIFPTNRFEKELKKLNKKFPSLKSEYANLITEISENPEIGTDLGHHCHKIRISIASKGKGKRGGARVVTYVYIESKSVYLLTIYDKGEKSDIKTNELKEMIESLDLD